MQLLEFTRRKRFDHVEHAKQQEADQGTRPANRNKCEGNEHANHFVDHHGAGIDPSEELLRLRAGPHPSRKEADDERDFDDG